MLSNSETSPYKSNEIFCALKSFIIKQLNPAVRTQNDSIKEIFRAYAPNMTEK